MSADDIELLERVVGDLAHTGPVVKGLVSFLTKYIDKQKITEMMQAGQHQLHLASTILEHKNVKTLLGHEGAFAALMHNYTTLQQRRLVFETSLEPLKPTDFKAKIKLSRQVSRWLNQSIAYKHNVVSQSDWAKLGLVLRDGKLVPIRQTLGSPSEQTLVPLTPRNVDKEVSKEDGGDESDDELCSSLPYVRFDDIPLSEAHVMEDPMSDGSGPSAPRKKVRFGKLLKGKARAQP